MKLDIPVELFKSRLKTVHTFTNTKIGKRLMWICVALFVVLFFAPLFHSTVGATLFGCVGAVMTVLVWRRYDQKHAIVPAVLLCIPMLICMVLYLSLTIATCMLIAIVSTLMVAIHPAFSYIKKIEDNMYAFLYAGAVCVVVVILSSLLTLLVSVAWWLFCLVLFVVFVAVFFSVVLSTAAYTATDFKRQKRKKELREYDLQQSNYDFDVFAQDLGLKRERDNASNPSYKSTRHRKTNDDKIFYDVD